MTTLLLAKHDNKTLNEATRKALSAAKALGAPVHVLVAGHGAQAVADAAAKLDGIETVKLKLPAIVTTDLRLNEPRYASLPNIMKAKKKPLAETTPEALGVDVSPRLKVLKTVEPAGRSAGVKVGSVAELVQKLKVEAGVL